MIIQLLSFVAGFATLVFYIAIFLVLMRFRPGMGWFGLQVILGGLVHILSSILFFYILDGFLYWYALGIFSMGWFSFFTLSTAIYVSISARILRTVDQQPAHALPLEKIFNVCVRKPFEERAEFLVHSGLAQRGEFGFIVTGKGFKNAQRLLSLRHFWGMEGAGLYSSAEDVIKDVEENENF